MRRLGKYASNQTIRYCPFKRLGAVEWEHVFLEKRSHNERSYRRTVVRPPDFLWSNKGNDWRLLNILRRYIEPQHSKRKILVRRDFNYQQYNGYSARLRAHPPKHVAFSRRPDFIYQPRTRFIKVNQETLNAFLRYGVKYLDDSEHFQGFFDIYRSDSPITLIYFMSGSEHQFETDWSLARKHAFGGSCADYDTKGTMDYCPFGPKIVSQIEKDFRIDQVIFVNSDERRRDLFHQCRCFNWHRLPSCYRGDKRMHSQLKRQRQEKTRLTKQIRDDRFAFS